MKRILLTSADYGLAFGVDRALRELISAGALSAVGCLVVSDLWSREYLPLRDTVDSVRHRTLVGLTLTLTRPFAPLSMRARGQFGSRFPKARWWRLWGALRLLPDEMLAEEVEAQLTCFEEFYQRPADFVHVADELLAVPALARVVLKQVALRRWPPRIVMPQLGPRAATRFARTARDAGLKVLERGPDFPETIDEAVHVQHLRRGMDGLSDRTVVFCQPGEIDDRLRRVEPRARLDTRSAQFAFFRGDTFPLLLMEKDIFLY
ncbi:ChbG/HpnK family deacetylase [Stappia indica]|uniref:ChbG/HpnK family deacetylase n=1 Tax=Stappia indica TaxID=538381 RepID=UPI001D196AF2|nr:ChbG/HpnK family deacetylase [Stappia indica]MCC4244152.1 ChbG/HpnK family deacetylase [Stappia indica]